MEAQTAQPPTSAGSSSSAFPRWVMLKKYCSLDDSAAGDTNTMAVARTSVGHLIQISLSIEDPVATVTVSIKVPDDDHGSGVEVEDCAVVAAHGDSFLIRVGFQFEEEQYQQGYTIDHFVYGAGDAATDPPRPPSLSLLPPCDVAGKYDPEKRVPQLHDACALGLLRRGEDELLVAELRTPRPVPELCVYRTGKWSLKRVPISYSDVDPDAGDALWQQLPSVWNSVVVPVGDRLLCWVHLSRGVMVICGDMFEDSPRLHYLRLPTGPRLRRWWQPSSEDRNVCTTAGSDALKFVSIIDGCCCSGATAKICCERSDHANTYAVHTWTLRMDADDIKMEWVKDGMIDCAELWALDTYKGLPCVPLDHPVVSMDEPHVIYFQLSEAHHVKYADQYTPLWLLKVDMRSKTIQSVSSYEDEDGFPNMGDILIPSNVTYFLNPYHHPSDGTLLSAQTDEHQEAAATRSRR